MIKISQFVESQLAVAFDRAEQMRFSAAIGGQLGKLLHVLWPAVVGVAGTQAAPASKLLNAGVEHACPEAVLESLMEVAHFPQFVFDPAGFDFFLKAAQRLRRRVVFVSASKAVSAASMPLLIAR